MSGRRAVVKRKCTFVGGFDTASHPSIVQLAWTQVLPWLEDGAERRAWYLWLHIGPPLDSISALGKWQFTLEHTLIKTPAWVVPGDWLLKTRIWKMCYPLCCTPISSGWKHHEDIKGIRSAIHNVFTWKKMTSLKFNFLWPTSEWPSYY